ncbi:MAG: ParB/RepB/Spo0J family partition protein [Clostridium sp.]|nr:ParB/RepB/Spo0J family partition protein [Clostridium sp.]
MVKRGLGKGLGALIPEEKKESSLMIDINKIKSNSEQPRKNFDNDKILELSESIKVHGIIQPLILKQNNDEYIIIAGERRWRAAKMAGIKEVPAIVMELSDKDILEISLIENIQREDLNPIEEAIAYKKLLTDFEITQEQLSERLGKSRTVITNSMRLMKLDERVQQYIIEGVLSEGHGRALLSIKDNNDLQYEVAQKTIDDGMSVRQLEKLIKSGVLERKPKKKQKELNPYYRDVKDKLQNHFGTKVNINANKGKGKIEIEYYSEEDLQRILDIINL